MLAPFIAVLILAAPATLTGSQTRLAPTLMAATLPEHWATTDAVIELPSKIVKEPFGDHSAAVHAELDEPLLDVHVAVIFSLLAKRQPQLSAVWEGKW